MPLVSYYTPLKHPETFGGRPFINRRLPQARNMITRTFSSCKVISTTASFRTTFFKENLDLKLSSPNLWIFFYSFLEESQKFKNLKNATSSSSSRVASIFYECWYHHCRHATNALVLFRKNKNNHTFVYTNSIYI